MSRVSKAFGRHKLVTALLGLGVLGSFTMGWAQPALAQTDHAAQRIPGVSRIVSHVPGIGTSGKDADHAASKAVSKAALSEQAQFIGYLFSSESEIPTTLSCERNAAGFDDDCNGYTTDGVEHLSFAIDMASGDQVLLATDDYGQHATYDLVSGHMIDVDLSALKVATTTVIP